VTASTLTVGLLVSAGVGRRRADDSRRSRRGSAGARCGRPTEAGSLREVVPSRCAERVRASVATPSRSERRRRRQPLVAVAVAVAATVIAVVAGGLLARQGDTGQPVVIAAAVTSYRTGHLDRTGGDTGPAACPAGPGRPAAGGGSTVTRVGQLIWGT